MLGTSPNAQRKGQAQCRGKTSEKAANTVVRNSASDWSILFTMLFSFYNHPQPLQVWADRTNLHPRKWNLHVDTGRRIKANIKGKENEKKGGPDPEVKKKEKEENMNLLGRGLKTGTIQVVPEESFCQIRWVRPRTNFIETMANRCPMTKAQPYKPTFYKLYCLGP